MIDSFECVTFLGLYMGQVSFRYFGRGRLSTESYSPKGGLVYQLLFTIVFFCLFKLPKWLGNLSNNDITNWWYIAIVQTAIPTFTMAYLMNYWLPVFTSKLFNYPMTLAEIDKRTVADDKEKGIQLKDQLISTTEVSTEGK